MRKRWTWGALLAVSLTMVAPSMATAKPSSRVRNNDWVEVWCDTNTGNRDGRRITLSLGADGATVGGPDDVLAKIVDASAFDPGMKDSNHYNQVAGAVQGWFCGELRYADGTIQPET
jgi:hypothetical protein